MQAKEEYRDKFWGESIPHEQSSEYRLLETQRRFPEFKNEKELKLKKRTL